MEECKQEKMNALFSDILAECRKQSATVEEFDYLTTKLSAKCSDIKRNLYKETFKSLA